jgi:hypothetical protein
VSAPARTFTLLPGTPRPRPYLQGQHYFEFKYAIVSATSEQLGAVRSYTDLRRLAGTGYCSFVGIATPDRTTRSRELEAFFIPDLAAERGSLPGEYRATAGFENIPSEPSYLLRFDIRRAATPTCNAAMSQWQSALTTVKFHVHHVLAGSFGSPPDPAGGPPRYPYVFPVSEADAEHVLLFETGPFFSFRPWQVSPLRRTYVELKYLAVHLPPNTGYGPGGLPDRAELTGSFGFVATAAGWESALVVYDGSFSLSNENW